MIWLIGAKGLLGSEIAQTLTKNKIPWIGTNSEVDVTDFQKLEAFEKTLETSSYYPSELSHADRKVRWVINCSGFTDVEAAELNPEECLKVNVLGSHNIARLCRDIGAKLIHISSDYVFNGNSKIPYTENSATDPLNTYGKSKLQAEIEIAKQMNTYYIIRTSSLYGNNGKSFVKTMISNMNNQPEVSIINNIHMTPTSASNLTDLILKLIEKSENATSLFGRNSAPNYGIYNYTDAGQTTWFEFAQTIYKYGKKIGLINNECKINPCLSEDYSSNVFRPQYSILNKEKISKTLKIKIPSWESSLERFLKSIN